MEYSIQKLHLLTVSVILIIRLSSGAKLNMLIHEETLRPTEFQQIAQDRSGNVYIAGRNVLYKLTDGLRLIDHITDQALTGPVRDGPNCAPNAGSNCRSAVSTDNDAVILEPFPEGEYLLFCGSVHQGLCSVYPMADLGNEHRLDATNVVNLIGNRKSAVAFFGQGNPMFSNGHTLYVGMSHDARPMQYSPKAVSSREIKQDRSGSRFMYNISYTYEATNDIVSGIDIDSLHKEDYIVKYVYGFEHEGFSYFVTVQRQDLITKKYTTKLVRVCQKDPRFYSYTEVEISCRKAELHSIFYNIAQAAYLSPVGHELASKFRFANDEQVLFVAFGKAGEGYGDEQEEGDTANRTFGHGICMYTMSDIRKYFQDTQKSCYSGHGTLLPWINRDFPPCTIDTQKGTEINNNEDFCGNPKNVGIGSRYPMQANANITRDHGLATALGIINYQGKTIAVVGTDDGQVVKVLVDGTNSPPYATITVGEGATDARVARDIAFDSNKQHMYTLTGNRVTKVPIQSCKVYNECSDCVTTQDPLSCGWCGDYCSTKTECLTHIWTRDSCPPVIYSFEPRSGPIQGGTRVTIQGHNFGTSNQNDPKVDVALVECVVEDRNSSSIVCRTGESKDLKEIDREVKVTVVDRSKTTVPFIIQGTATTEHESFSYKRPVMTDFSPRIGPKSGGTLLTVQGRNLDIGSRLDIKVGYLPCLPVKVNSTAILCSTHEWINEFEFLGKVRRRRAVSSGTLLETPAGEKRRRARRAVNTDTLLEGTVNVTIDSANLHGGPALFTYKPDPVITSVQPKASILSGGLHIEVGGTNLNVVHHPKIVATVSGEEHIQYQAPCEAREDGLVMHCKSPTVDRTRFLVTEESPLDVHIHFLMDGVQSVYNLSETNPELSRFQYVVDPVFEKFLGYGYTRTFYEDETMLDIPGRYIDLVDITDDLRVTVGGTKCNVTRIGYNIVICAPERPAVFTDNEPKKRVVVKIGYLEFEVGDLQFAKRDPNILLAQIVGPMMGLGLAMVVIVIVCWMKRTRRGPWRKRVLSEPHVRYHAGEIVQIGTEQDGTAIYRMNNNHNQNPYWNSSSLPHHGNQGVRQRAVAAHDESTLMDDESRRLIEDANLLISRESLILCDIIGQGHFGCVYRGFMRREDEKEEIEVAIKTLKSLSDSQYISSTDGRKFLEEALRMRDFDHPHILTLIGIALDKDCDMPLVVLPFMRHGDLLSFIRDEMNSPTVKDLMDFAIQVSRGMAYLANLKFVHRDLAARNCMLDDRMNVKVADFGLSRDIYERDYYSSDDRKAKLPVKWMALESLEKGIYNNKTDVWSYGVVLWELMTRGVCPYPDVDNWDIIKYLKSGRRMPQPQYCPDHLYMTMLQCWDADPKLRPSFAELVMSVENIIANMLSAHEHVGLNVTYINVPTTQGYLYPTPTPTVNAPPEGAAYFGHYDNNNLSSAPPVDPMGYQYSDSGGSLPPVTFPYVNAASKSTLV